MLLIDQKYLFHY